MRHASVIGQRASINRSRAFAVYFAVLAANFFYENM